MMMTRKELFDYMEKDIGLTEKILVDNYGLNEIGLTYFCIVVGGRNLEVIINYNGKINIIGYTDRHDKDCYYELEAGLDVDGLEKWLIENYESD